MYSNSSDAERDAAEGTTLAALVALYVLVSVIGIIGNVSLMAALASGGASRLRTPQMLSACAADFLVCAASAPLAATRAARIDELPCQVTYYIELGHGRQAWPWSPSLAMVAKLGHGRQAWPWSPSLAMVAKLGHGRQAWPWSPSLAMVAKLGHGRQAWPWSPNLAVVAKLGHGRQAWPWSPSLAVVAKLGHGRQAWPWSPSLAVVAKLGHGRQAWPWSPSLASNHITIIYYFLNLSLCPQSFPVAASTLSLVAIAADRCGAVRRGGTSLCARPHLAVVRLCAAAFTTTCVSCPPLAAAHALVTYCFPVLAVAKCHWAVRVKLTALSLTARAAHGELPLPVPLMRRPTHVIIVAGVGPRERRDAVDVGDVRSKKKLQPSLLGPQPQTSTLRSRRRLGNVLMGIAAIFAVCWCPHAAIVIASAFGLHVPFLLAHFALLLGYAHSALNAVAYWVLNRHALTSACAAWRLPQLRVREERPSSTNEAALGAFHPRLARPAPSPRPPPSSFLY
ncbi:hypothetical protein SFRURICE_007155 [Spodoptera frugiperda]|nr:hypothetical protein SFRURICE_007155 [Spodoptera frugiperda]